MAETEPLSLEDLERAAEAFAALVDRGLTEVVEQVLEELQLNNAEDLAELSPAGVDQITVLWEAFVASTLVPFLAESMRNANTETAAGLVRALDTAIPALDEPLDTQRVLAQARNRLVGIGNELWFHAREAIAAGLSEGESIPAIAARVRDAANVSAPRASVIARTESHGARNLVNALTVRRAASMFNAPAGAIRRRWQSHTDERTRETHRRADGQEVALNEPFRVGRASLDFPGDPSGPADEVINCRCTTITVLDVAALDLEPADSALTLNAAAFQEDEHMPWSIVEGDSRCDAGEFAVVKDDDNELEGCHASREAAADQIAALEIAEAGEGQDVDASTDRNTVPFSGVIVVEGAATGDGRQYAVGSLTWPEVGVGQSLEIPLGWKFKRAHGGMDTDNTVDVGRIDSIERVGNELHARGVLNLDSQWGRQAAREMGTRDNPGFLAGVSIVADDPERAEVEYVFPESCALDEDGFPSLEEGEINMECMMPELEIYHSGRIRAADLVSIPAYVEARLYLDEALPDDLPDDDEALSMPITASAYTIEIPDLPPRTWFDEPSDEPDIGAITVTDEGRIFGYLAPKHVAHRGHRDRRIEVPYGNVDYGVWMNRVTLADNGSGGFDRVATGPITMDCGHAPQSPRVKGAARREHYDNSCSVVATVRAGENARGVWIAGALLPDVSAEQVRRMMSCQLSGDWGPHREKPGKRELAAALLVPVPGFPRRSYSHVNVRHGVLDRVSIPVRFGKVERARETFNAQNVAAAAERIAASVGHDRASRVRRFAAHVDSIMKGA